MDNISNKLFYKKSIQEFGVSAQGVHWNNKYTQYKRFEMITKFIRKEITTSSIVDAGCGFAEYYNYLIKNNKKPKSYIGIDCEKYMIDVSQKKYPYLEFKLLDIINEDIPKADYYIASGSLNILDLRNINVFITKCFNSSNKGVVFNFLKDITFTDVTQDDIFNICKNLTQNVTQNIQLKENYLENDFTIFIKKGDS